MLLNEITRRDVLKGAVGGMFAGSLGKHAEAGLNRRGLAPLVKQCEDADFVLGKLLSQLIKRYNIPKEDAQPCWDQHVKIGKIIYDIQDYVEGL